MAKVWLVTGSARGLGRAIVEAALAVPGVTEPMAMTSGTSPSARLPAAMPQMTLRFPIARLDPTSRPTVKKSA